MVVFNFRYPPVSAAPEWWYCRNTMSQAVLDRLTSRKFTVRHKLDDKAWAQFTFHQLRSRRSELLGCQIVTVSSVRMNCVSALSVPRGKFLPTDPPYTHGCSGRQRVTRSLRTFTLCHVHALEIRTRVEEQGNCGYTQLNLHSYRNTMTILHSGGNGDQITLTSEEVLESDDEPLPTMEDIQEVAREQGLKVEVRSLGPWFQINLMNADETVTMGSAEGFETRWTEGKILHLEAIRLTRAAKSSSMLGPGFLVGAAAMRYGLDKNCPKAELLAINDDNETHTRLLKYYSRMGFKAMYELTEESWGDILDRVVWGGIGTRMDANCEELLRKWAKLLKPKSEQANLNPIEGFPQNQKLGENQQYQ